MKRVLFATMLLAMGMLHAFGQEHSVLSDADYAELRTLKIEQAAADARRSVATKDFRLLAVRGYTVEIPGASGDVSKLKTEYGLKVLAGTSDAFRGEEQVRLNANAHDYARRSNETILSSVRH
jgi:hypothetical protein